jgi:ankyrin repeat protein
MLTTILCIDAIFEESTALHIASRNGFVDIVKCLLSHNAHILIKDAEDHTPLGVATEEEVKSILKGTKIVNFRTFHQLLLSLLIN